ncbi:MAG: cupredoxin domain-containing protein [Candidatus Dormibacteraceae bacterium]
MSLPRAASAMLAALAAVAALAATSCSQDTLASRQVDGVAATVHLIGSPETVGVFRPGNVHVTAGQTVAWLNASGNYHTVTFETAGLTSSPGFGPGKIFEMRFDRPGVYRYRCEYHQGMTGEVTVSP